MDANKILLGERGIPVSSEVSSDIASLLDDNTQKVITFVNDVVTPNSSTIDPPAPDGSAEVIELINTLVEQVCYGEKTSQEAAEELLTQGSAALAK